MPRYYYIGIGGTGARVAEALIHLCAAGHGPREFFFFLVDPDQNNGNLARTKKLLADYRTVRKHLGGGVEGLFGTEIMTPAEAVVWNVFDKHDATLAAHIKYPILEQQNRPLAQLADVLFTPQELVTELNEGFRGHPSIGAAVMAKPSDDEDPWRAFWDDVSKVSTPGDARVFLAGSIFGGTGAAGVPTFGSRNLIKSHEKAKIGDQSRVTLGGCLVLPYFTFDTNVPSSQADKLFVTWKDFPLATRAALDYYALRGTDLVFDDLYLLGDNLAQSVGSFGAGANNQNNQPHYVELAAALSALDFWENSKAAPSSRNFFTAARNDEIVSLESLPVTRREDALIKEQERLRFDVVGMTLFCYAVSTYGLEVTGPGEDNYPWYREWFKFDPKREESERFDPKSTPQQAKLKAVADFGKNFLQWLAGMASDDRVQLVETAALLDDQLWSAKQPRPRQVNERGIGQTVRGRDGGDFNSFIAILNHSDVQPKVGAEAADRLLSGFATAARRFAQEKLKVPGLQGAR